MAKRKTVEVLNSLAEYSKGIVAGLSPTDAAAAAFPTMPFLPMVVRRKKAYVSARNTLNNHRKTIGALLGEMGAEKVCAQAVMNGMRAFKPLVTKKREYVDGKVQGEEDVIHVFPDFDAINRAAELNAKLQGDLSQNVITEIHNEHTNYILAILEQNSKALEKERAVEAEGVTVVEPAGRPKQITRSAS